MSDDLRDSARFVALAWILSAALGLALAAAGGPGSPGSLAFGLAVMWVPAASALALRAATGAPLEGLGWRLGWRWALVAVAVPVAVTAAAGFGTLAAMDRLAPAPDAPDPMRAAAGAVVNLAILLALALGEEIGWRGFLQLRLERLLGVRRGIVAVALVWSVWHLPFGLQGFHHPEHPILGSLVLAPLVHLGAGGFFGWLHVRTRSVLAVALAHAALNNTSKVPFRFVRVEAADELPIYVAICVLFAACGLAFVARSGRAAEALEDEVEER